MRTIYVIRHGQIDLSQSNRRCISETDIALDDIGILQAERLRQWARGVPLEAVFASPLKRCAKTAEIMADKRVLLRFCGELREMSVGAWENMSFDQIRNRYPDEYAARGVHLGTIPPPGGESFIQAGKRLLNVIKGLLAETNGDIAIVSHSGVNRGALCLLTGHNPDRIMEIYQPYGGINIVGVTTDGDLDVRAIGQKPDSVPPLFEREILFEKHKTPAAVKEHCRAVADVAMELAGKLNGVSINTELLRAACELHDLVRGAKQGGIGHAERGADILRSEGYPIVAALVAGHNDLPPDAEPEAQLLYLADKLVLGTTRVTLEERFAVSAKKCLTDEARKAWARRMDDARAIIRHYNLRE